MRRCFSTANVLDRAHVVRTVGELHEDDAQVLRHREQHLAEAFGLRLGRAVETQVVDLADAVDEQRDVVAEARCWISGSVLAVSSTTSWQQRGFDRPRVEMQAREDLGHRDRMGDVGVAVPALLALSNT